MPEMDPKPSPLYHQLSLFASTEGQAWVPTPEDLRQHDLAQAPKVLDTDRVALLIDDALDALRGPLDKETAADLVVLLQEASELLDG